MKLSRRILFALATVLLLSAGATGIALLTHRTLPSFFNNASIRPEAKPGKPHDRNAEITQHAFRDSIIELQVFPAIETLTEITERLDGMYFPYDQFYTAYAQLSVDGAERLQSTIQVDYHAADRNYSAFAYWRAAGASPSEPDCAALIIPGSGKNQSTPIFNRDAENYHGDILGVFEPRCDSYVLVKPNEDFLAIHDGSRKLSYDFILRYLLHQGGSYSARYLVDSLAVTKYLQSRYMEVYVAGLSQGGEAALLNALQSEPTAVVVASGFSWLSEQIDWAGFSQIIIPGLRREYSNERIFEIIQHSKTRFLFTYGKQETGTYRIEAEEHLACQAFAPLHNVECGTHPAGHTFDRPLVEQFINKRQ